MRSLMRRRLFVVSVGMALCVSVGGLRAQFDDTFNADPFASGDWISNSNWGGPTWVPEGSLPCADPNVFDPLDPCTVDEAYDGYVLVTDPAGNRGGNFFRTEPDFYDNFKLTVEVELRDGGTALGRPADGMVVVVVGGENPPSRLGALGGGMGAPCVGGAGPGADDLLPQLSWEFDNWSCNTGDAGPGRPGVTGDAGGFPDSQWHHVAFSYSPTGFACTDAIPPQVWAPFARSTVRLHNQEPAPAPANRFRMTVYAQLCGGDLTVACDLEAIDQGINLGRVYTFVVPDYEPFEGYLGVTASTGGAWQNHILHSAKLEPLPAGFCLQPVGETSRDITIRNPDVNLCGDYENGTIADVSLTLANLRQADACCTAATSGRVVETVPANWTISGISSPGTAVGQTITWNLSGGDFVDGKVLSYTATATAAASGAAAFAGNTSDGLGGVQVFTSGESKLNPNQPFDICGRIKCWNVLSALYQSGGAGPGIPAIQQDYLSDGSQTELDFVFEPGAEIAPEFFGAAASTGVFEDPNGRAPNALSGIATVTKYVSPDGFVDLNNVVYGGAPDNVMTYAQIYVNSDVARDVFIASDSDDSIQIILNEQEVWVNSIPRGNDAGCPVGLVPPNRQRLRDVTPAPVPLNQGENRLIVKTFEGGGDFNFEVRFENADGSEKPVTQGLTLSHTPSNPTCRVAPAVVTRAIDTHREVGGQDVWSNADIGGAPFDVSLTLSDIRPAGGICAAAGMVTIVETVPAGWTPSNPSNGGTVSGLEVRWTIPATNGAMVSYDVSPDGNLADVAFSGAVTEPASLNRFGVRGERAVSYAPSPFARVDPETFTEGFVDDEGLCPDGWTCNTGAGLFMPVVNADGRLQLACATDNASCGGGATSVISNEPLDLTNQSFKAEFDVFLSHPGAVAVGNPPADALTFVVVDADTYADPTLVIGAAGGCNGYCNLTRSFAVEFDLWQNDATEPSGYNNPLLNYTHVGAIRDGAVLPHVQTHLDVVGPDAFPTRLGGTGWPEMVDFTGGTGFPIHFEVDYNNGNLQVFMEAPETTGPLGEIELDFPRTMVLDTVLTFPPVVAGDEPVLQNAWIGFTAGTGGAIIAASVDDIVLTVYQSATVVAEICDNGTDDDGDTKADCEDTDCAAAVNCLLGTKFVRGDADVNGTLQLTDAVRILNVLFLGTGVILCDDAADSDDNGTIQLTDAVRILNVLFLGTGVIPAPGVCGTDPTDTDALGCTSYPPCSV